MSVKHRLRSSLLIASQILVLAVLQGVLVGTANAQVGKQLAEEIANRIKPKPPVPRPPKATPNGNMIEQPEFQEMVVRLRVNRLSEEIKSAEENDAKRIEEEVRSCIKKTILGFPRTMVCHGIKSYMEKGQMPNTYEAKEKIQDALHSIAVCHAPSRIQELYEMYEKWDSIRVLNEELKRKEVTSLMLERLRAKLFCH